MDYEISLPVLEDLNGYKEWLVVLPESSFSHKQALEMMARYFKNESRYDWLQYCANEHDAQCTGVLICERAMDLVKDDDNYPNRVVGGAGFQETGVGTYTLDWIWLHPFARNRGKLKRLWPTFKDKFGSFGVTKPLSAHMASFIDKHA